MEALCPDIFSFITLRKERFGGFCFNPFLLKEISLNPMEMRLAELCNGEKTVGEIISLLAQEGQMSVPRADAWVRTVLQRLNEMYAIHWREEKKSPASLPHPQDLGESTPVACLDEVSGEFYTAPFSVIFELTYRCNLSCQHCLVNAGRAEPNELATVEVLAILDQFKEMKVFTVNFGGGEPLLRPDFYKIMQYASDLNFGIIFSTNGYSVDAHVLDQLSNIKSFALQISVDGLEATHDQFRGIKGSFSKAIWALKEFSDRGYHTTMSTMLLKTNLHEMRPLIDLALSLGVSALKLSTFMPAGRGDRNSEKYALTQAELIQAAELILAEKQKHDGNFYIDNKATYPWLFEKNQRGSSCSPRSLQIGCSAARTNIVISPTGEVYPCPFLHQFSAGNLRERRLADIWNHAESFSLFRQLNTNQLSGKCSSCEYIPEDCQGGCRAAAFLKTGNFFAEDPFCWKK